MIEFTNATELMRELLKENPALSRYAHTTNTHECGKALFQTTRRLANREGSVKFTRFAENGGIPRDVTYVRSMATRGIALANTISLKTLEAQTAPMVFAGASWVSLLEEVVDETADASDVYKVVEAITDDITARASIGDISTYEKDTLSLVRQRVRDNNGVAPALETDSGLFVLIEHLISPSIKEYVERETAPKTEGGALTAEGEAAKQISQQAVVYAYGMLAGGM